MKPPTLRRARGEDAAVISALVQAAFEPYLTRMPCRPAPMDDDYAAVIETADVWVVETTGPRGVAGGGCGYSSPEEIVGVVVMRRTVDHLLVDTIAVHPGAQRTGIASRLLHLVDERACAAGLSEIRLYTNVAMTENLTFYPRHGYVETHRASQGGFDRVFFSRRIRTDGH